MWILFFCLFCVISSFSTLEFHSLRRLMVFVCEINYFQGNAFIGVGLEKGFLKIAYSVDNRIESSLVSLPFYYKISDGLWHNIEINFAPFTIKLDQNKIVYKGKHRKMLENATVSTDGLFYIGGIPTKSTIGKETNGTFVQTFEGCIEGFATNGEKIIRDFTNFEGTEINVCKIL
jgi:hypothetical protein